MYVLDFQNIEYEVGIKKFQILSINMENAAFKIQQNSVLVSLKMNKPNIGANTRVSKTNRSIIDQLLN